MLNTCCTQCSTRAVCNAQHVLYAMLNTCCTQCSTRAVCNAQHMLHAMLNTCCMQCSTRAVRNAQHVLYAMHALVCGCAQCIIVKTADTLRADWHYTSRFRSVTVPSPFRQNGLCVHTVRRVQSPSRTAHDRTPAIISIKYATHCRGMRFQLFVNY